VQDIASVHLLLGFNVC